MYPNDPLAGLVRDHGFVLSGKALVCSRCRERPGFLTLKCRIASAISSVMTYGWAARFRAVTLLLALGMGLIAQAVPGLAMSISPSMDQAPGIAMGSPNHCPACAGGESSMAMTPACAAAFCSVAPAILSQAPTIEPSPRLSFRPVGFDMNPGLTVPPTLGPPRPSFHS